MLLLLLLLLLLWWGESKLLGIWAVNCPLYQPQIHERNGAFGGMRTGRGNHGIWRKLAPVSLCLPKSHIN
jgi:hypothetical protein